MDLCRVLVLLGSLTLGAASHAQSSGTPTVEGTPSTAVAVGRAYVFTPTVTVPGGQSYNFAISNLPAWATFDTTTGRLQGIPAASHIGIHSGIRIQLKSGQYFVSLPLFSIEVVAGNSAPSIAGTPGNSVTVGKSYSFTPSASDADGDALTYSITGKPAWASFSSSTGRLSGSPGSTRIGSYPNIVISVSDGEASAKLPPFSINVLGPNATPTIGGTPSGSAPVGKSYSFTPSASDADGNALSFSIANKPAWASFSASTGRLYGTPGSTRVGTYSNIIISVSDGGASASLPPFAITVAAPNAPPTIGGMPSGSVNVGKSYSFTPSASDADGDAVTFSIANKPAWASFNSGTGRLSGTPGSTRIGTYSNIVIGVSDGQGSAALPPFTITVVAAGAPATGSATVSWSPPSTYVDGKPLASLAGYRVVYGQSSSDLSNSVIVPSPLITSAVIEALTPGTWYFAVKAYTTASIESDLSSVAYKIIN